MVSQAPRILIYLEQAMPISMTKAQSFVYLDTSVDKIFIAGTQDLITNVFIGEKRFQKEAHLLLEERSSPVLEKAMSQLSEYFAGKRTSFDLKRDLDLSIGTNFQQAVWHGLMDIPYGETRSYAWLAAHIGKEGSSRAVGNANGANPIPIIVPCHRVVLSSGGLGGFTGGLHYKEALLGLEGSWP